MNKAKTRAIGFILTLVLALSTVFSSKVSAAGTETLNVGETPIGSFTFTNTNTTPIKTIKGTKVTFTVNWRVADGASGAPDVDKGIGDAKLTMKVLDASTGKTIAGPKTFKRGTGDDTWYLTNSITVNVKYGQKVRVWFDASSVGQSNGKYRSIYIRNFEAKVSK